MKPKKRTTEQDDLLRPRLIDMIDPRHELVKLTALIDWEVFEREWSGFFLSGTGRPATPPRLQRQTEVATGRAPVDVAVEGGGKALVQVVPAVAPDLGVDSVENIDHRQGLRWGGRSSRGVRDICDKEAGAGALECAHCIGNPACPAPAAKAPPAIGPTRATM